MTYDSLAVVESESTAGVSFTIAKISFGRRIELLRLIRDLAAKAEFLDAGNSTDEKLEGALLSAQIDRLYLSWGIVKIEGLDIDGCPATPELLASAGPEVLFQEAVTAVKRQCGLSDEERKN